MLFAGTAQLAQRPLNTGHTAPSVPPLPSWHRKPRSSNQATGQKQDPRLCSEEDSTVAPRSCSRQSCAHHPRACEWEGLQSRVRSRPTARMTFRKGTPGGPDLLRRVLKRGGALSGERDSTHEKFCCWLQRHREPCARSGGGLRLTARSKQARVLPDGSWLSGHPKASPRGPRAYRHLTSKCWEP